MSKRDRQENRLLAERIEAEAKMRKAEMKHERQMRRLHEKFIARETAEARRLEREHFGHLNNADATALRVSEETAALAKEVASLAVTKAQYEQDREADRLLRESEAKVLRGENVNTALNLANRQGQIQGREQLLGLSRNLVLFVLAVATSIILVLRFFLPL